ncbi:general transcription factor 3C polypeptide 1 [Platysternon megacephalum]|uniref:General transcription factor 3C polypeptide 1 n=1 Tax=Platysternon megacephalum TaxID=55544 RepID=A0A4D9ECV9_9SAUR|nr:general transcription factor 3C polypeptide 1 [Platysternon megacephalum]
MKCTLPPLHPTSRTAQGCPHPIRSHTAWLGRGTPLPYTQSPGTPVSGNPGPKRKNEDGFVLGRKGGAGKGGTQGRKTKVSEKERWGGRKDMERKREAGEMHAASAECTRDRD